MVSVSYVFYISGVNVSVQVFVSEFVLHSLYVLIRTHFYLVDSTWWILQKHASGEKIALNILIFYFI